MAEPSVPLPFPTRLWFAWVCLLRVLFDAEFAGRAWRAREPAALPPAPKPAALAEGKVAELPGAPALQLLALLQRDGRLVDFLQQEIVTFTDAEVGEAARVVHDGCRKALLAHVTLSPILREEEGATVTIQAGYSPAEVKLSGNVQGSAPFRGTLRHRGWRAKDLALPTPVKGHEPGVLAPAEVEL